jgi:hypothetical protein
MMRQECLFVYVQRVFVERLGQIDPPYNRSDGARNGLDAQHGTHPALIGG